MTTPPTGLTVTVNPPRSYTYFVRGTINGCEQIDSIRVQIDSLPRDLSFAFEEDKDVYCRGERVIIRSPDYEPGDFPGITHQWINAPGSQTPDSLYNLVFNTVDTAFYTRVTVNGACVDTVSQEVFVVEPPMVTITPMDTTVCAGDRCSTRSRSKAAATSPGAGHRAELYGMPRSGSDGRNLDQLHDQGRIRAGRLRPDLQRQPERRAGDRHPGAGEITICPGETVRLLLSNPQPNVTYTWTTPSDPDFVSNDPLLTVTRLRPPSTALPRRTAAVTTMK